MVCEEESGEGQGPHKREGVIRQSIKLPCPWTNCGVPKLMTGLIVII